MEQEERSQEEIAKAVTTAFESVEIINELNSKESLSEHEVGRRIRNVKHLQGMIVQEWFEKALTDEQKVEINKLTK